MNLLDKVKVEEKDIEDKFIPIEEQFAILDKWEVIYDSEVSTKRLKLFSDWSAFKDNIVSCEEVSVNSNLKRNIVYFSRT